MRKLTDEKANLAAAIFEQRRKLDSKTQEKQSFADLTQIDSKSLAKHLQIQVLEQS
jgi:hypothetical protein